MYRSFFKVFFTLFAVYLLSACSGESDANKITTDEKQTPVTIHKVSNSSVEVVETTVGRVASLNIPVIKSETMGQVSQVLVAPGDRVASNQILLRINNELQQLALNSAQATADRFKIQMTNQTRTVSRLRKLVTQKSVSQGLFDDAVAKLSAEKASYKEALAKRDQAAIQLSKTSVTSPINGVVQLQHVSAGDFVKTGDALFELVNDSQITIYLPVPDRIGQRIKVGQIVRLTNHSLPDKSVTAEVSELKPMVGSQSYAMDVIVTLANPGQWRAGSSVTGEIVVSTRLNSILVPEIAVVMRPNGAVVYTVEDDIAKERIIQRGLEEKGLIEVLSGLQAGETIVMNGAGFLTDGAKLIIRNPAQ